MIINHSPLFRRILATVFSICSIVSFAQTTSISGIVTALPSNEPVPFVPVIIQGTTTGSTTDENGKYSIPNLEPGLYNIECAAIGYKKAIAFEVEATKDRPAVVDFQLEEVTNEIGPVDIVSSRRTNEDESPVSVRSIGVNEIKRNPGGDRDISKVIRTLPGVAAIPSFRNDLIIRGGAANENRFYIDGIEIPNINHFATQGSNGGPRGLINVDLINEVEFYSGAYPAARGNALSSVMEFQFKDPKRDKWASNIIVGSSDIGITLEGPTSKNSGLTFSARRSYLQFLFSALGLPFLPAYNDYNLKWKWDINDKNKLSVVSLGALDNFTLNLKLAEDTANENFNFNRYLLDNLVINNQWNYAFGVKWDNYGDKGKWTVVASRNMLQNDAFKYYNNDETLPRKFDYSSSEQENKLRIERKISGNGWKLLYGVGYEYAQYFNYSNLSEYNPIIADTFRVSYRTTLNMHKYSAFLQSSKTMLNERLTLSAGLRADGNDFNSEMSNLKNQISPRVSLRYAFAPQWSFNANAGIYYQQPNYLSLGYRINDEYVNRNMRYVRNTQAVAGVQYSWDKRNTIISLEGFYKYYERYPISVNRGISIANLGADFGTVGNEALTSDGLGRAYGAEVLYQQRFFKGMYGILAYTYVISEFTNAAGTWAPSSWDSRNLISITGGKQFKKNWEVGFVFRFSGGLPFTPDDETASMNIQNWNALGVAITDWSQLNTQRASAYQQLDIRVDKKWYLKRWTLDLYFDIQNATGYQTQLKPLLDVQRDALGNPVVNPNNPSQYLPNSIANTNGTVLPSVGII
ncbi:MAG: TonB-dependent receptor, partial [Flavobacteriales bacterium]